MAVRDGFEGGFQIRVGLQGVYLLRFDERNDAAPSGSAFIVTSELCILGLPFNLPMSGRV